MREDAQQHLQRVGGGGRLLRARPRGLCAGGAGGHAGSVWAPIGTHTAGGDCGEEATELRTTWLHRKEETCPGCRCSVTPLLRMCQLLGAGRWLLCALKPAVPPGRAGAPASLRKERGQGRTRPEPPNSILAAARAPAGRVNTRPHIVPSLRAAAACSPKGYLQRAAPCG